MAAQTNTLISPDGKREWVPADATEATNLRARGWSEKPAAKPAPKSEK